MKIKKGDKVIVIAGKDKGKTGSVIKALPKDAAVVVESINMRKRHERARKSNQKGQIIDKAMPMSVSNVMLLDPKGGKRTRLRIERKDGKRFRVAVKTGATI